MNHDFLRILADLAIFLIVVALPSLWVIYTDRFRRQPDPEQYAALLALAALAGVLLFLPALSIIAGTILLVYGLAWLTGRLALVGVGYERELTPGRMFMGEEAELTIRLRNWKLLPLAWIGVSDPIQYSTVQGTRKLDDVLRFSGGIDILDNQQYALVSKTAMGMFQSLNRTYRLEGRQRGVYSLGPARIESGDAFGLFRREMKVPGHHEIIVYPRLYSPDEIGFPLREAMGSVMTRRMLLEDPTLLAGSREYRPGDTMRRMHWKATARTGELQVRVCDPSTTATVMVVVNLNTFQHVWQGVDAERMEATISVAASLALWALDRDCAVGVRSNGIVAGVENAGRIAPSAHPRQRIVLLEHLARLAFAGSVGAEGILLDEARRMGRGASIVFVTPTLTPSLIHVLTAPPLAGKVSVVYCGRFAAPVVRGLHVHLATPPLEPTRAVS